MAKSVTVKVPATTANLGPGFDCLSMALDIWNIITVQVGAEDISISGEGAESLSRGHDNLVYRAISLPFQDADLPVPGLSVSCQNLIPLCRGLGSSAATVVGGLLAGNELCGRRLSRERLLELAAEMEGHPDNVTAALLGGCRIVVRDDGNLVTAPIPVPDDLMAVIFIPDVLIPTKEARDILPGAVSREDAVYNIGRVALLVRALATSNLEHLRVATQDRLHQPARQTIFPAMEVIFRSALEAGALGVFLSGGGSSVLALAKGGEMSVGQEMTIAAEKAGVTGTLKITGLSQLGAHIVDPG